MKSLVAAWVAAVVAFGAAASAQTNTVEVAGVVMDASGGVLPGATVTATHAASGTVVSRVTDGEGRFFLPALRTGAWDVTVALAGFSPQTRTGILLEIGSALTLDFKLDVEGLSENLTVAANAQDLAAADGPPSSNCDGRSSTSSIARISMCRTASLEVRTSAACPARKIRAKCSSELEWPSRARFTST